MRTTAGAERQRRYAAAHPDRVADSQLAWRLTHRLEIAAARRPGDGHRGEDPADNRKRAREWLRARRAELLDLLGGPVCARCGCTEPGVLQVNHRNGGGAREIRELARKTRFTIWLLRALRSGERRAEDYDVLCAVCNILDHVERLHPELAGRWHVRFNRNEPPGG